METGEALARPQVGVRLEVICARFLAQMEVLEIICSNPRDSASELDSTINFLKGIVVSILPYVKHPKHKVIRMKWKLLKTSQFLLKIQEKEILALF